MAQLLFLFEDRAWVDLGTGIIASGVTLNEEQAFGELSGVDGSVEVDGRTNSCSGLSMELSGETGLE